MNIRYEGSLTREEFMDVVMLAGRPVLKKSGFAADLWVIFLVLGLGIIATGVVILFTAENMGAGVVVAAIGAIFIFFSIKSRNAIDQAWENYQKSGLRREGSITDHYLEIRFSTGNSQVFWTGFKGYGEYHNLLVLFQGEVAVPFADRFFQTETDWQEFKKFVSRRLPITHRVSGSSIDSENWFIWVLLILSVIALIIMNK